MQVASIDFSFVSSLAIIIISVCLILWLLQMLITNKRVYFIKKEKVSELKENIFLIFLWIRIIIFNFYFESLLVYLHVLLYGFSKDNITFEYSSLFNDDT